MLALVLDAEAGVVNVELEGGLVRDASVHEEAVGGRELVERLEVAHVERFRREKADADLVGASTAAIRTKSAGQTLNLLSTELARLDPRAQYLQWCVCDMGSGLVTEMPKPMVQSEHLAAESRV